MARNTFVLGLAAILITSATALAATPVPPPAPNYYQVSGGGLQITYITQAGDGKPLFSYKDPSRTLEFSGDQIRTIGTEDGTLVTVTIIPTVDSGTTTFSLLVPVVNLDETLEAPISTEGITSDHKFSIIRKDNEGQLKTYKFTGLGAQKEGLTGICPLRPLRRCLLIRRQERGEAPAY